MATLVCRFNLGFSERVYLWMHDSDCPAKSARRILTRADAPSKESLSGTSTLRGSSRMALCHLTSAIAAKLPGARSWRVKSRLAIPLRRAVLGFRRIEYNSLVATLAQLVEQCFRKAWVKSPNLLGGSFKTLCQFPDTAFLLVLSPPACTRLAYPRILIYSGTRPHESTLKHRALRSHRF